MAEEQEPGPGAAEGAEAPAVETPGWQVPEDSGAQPESYEIRHYGPAKWVCTSVESRDWDSAIQTGFTRLTSYIQGKNEKEMKMKMTAPVVSYVEPGSGPFSESTITVSLYVPSEQQPDPPRPSESDVFIEDRAAMTVFVRTRDGCCLLRLFPLLVHGFFTFSDFYYLCHSCLILNSLLKFDHST
ncbi:heme-binding protein 2 isoform X4 [Pipistrellus kuhlii]|uniref:heme-binding protein 2 isoform X4 n=1 Tax=Pipistrellus kuhlii TaxID=59472 RepID=UPI00174EFBA5|nr:heme-binding protein 2 isoform X4 [Pipistrellus kuhlii]